MIIFFAAVLILLVLSAVIYRNYEKEFISKEVKKQGILKFLYPAGLKITDIVSKMGKASDGEMYKWADAVYVNDNPENRLRLEGARQAAILWICIFAASAIGIMVCLLPQKQEQVEELIRPEFGTEQSYNLKVDGIDESVHTVKVSVSGREPDTSGMEEVFEEAFENVKEEMKGSNKSLSEVRSDLKLPSSTIYGIRISWKSLDPEYMSDFGRIMSEDIPPEGVSVVMRADMTYSTYEYSYDYICNILPPEKNAEYIMKQLVKQLDDSGSSHTEKTMLLPVEIEGHKISFYSQDSSIITNVPWMILLVSLAALLIKKQKLKEKYNKRNDELTEDYPILVFELGIMLQCGMTIRSSWNRMLAEYEDKQKRCHGFRRYLYEEMLKTRKEIASGISEGAAYEAFGRRCTGSCYLQLGSRLEQNLKHGVSGLCSMMDQELEDALTRQKNSMLKKGERMETKMLIPLFMMLILVMAILVIPAFINM